MERRKKLKAIQLCLLSIGVLTLIFTYSDKISFKKDLITQELKKEIENKTIDKNESIKGNVFYNIEYSGLDLAGNRYILKSKSATNNNLNKDLIDMTGVTATFYFKDGTVL